MSTLRTGLAEFHRSTAAVISLISLNLLGKMGFGAFGGFRASPLRVGAGIGEGITKATAIAAPIIV